jgi:hypothetical protein
MNTHSIQSGIPSSMLLKSVDVGMKEQVKRYVAGRSYQDLTESGSSWQYHITRKIMMLVQEWAVPP